MLVVVPTRDVASVRGLLTEGRRACCHDTDCHDEGRRWWPASVSSSPPGWDWLSSRALLVAIDERVKHVALGFLARIGGAIQSPAVIGESILDTVQALHASNAALFIFAGVGTVLLFLMLKT